MVQRHGQGVFNGLLTCQRVRLGRWPQGDTPTQDAADFGECGECWQIARIARGGRGGGADRGHGFCSFTRLQTTRTVFKQYGWTGC